MVSDSNNIGPYLPLAMRPGHNESSIQKINTNKQMEIDYKQVDQILDKQEQ